MGIAVITAYKTADEKVFENEKEAKRYDTERARNARLRDWASRHCYHGMTSSDVADELIEHGHELGV